MSPRQVPVSTPKILAEVRDGVGWIVINNPERRNAVSLEMWQGLADATAALAADPEVRVVVLRGAGGKAFAAGADISEFEKHRADAAQTEQYGEVASRGQSALEELEKPLIAMIQGYCIGGGLAIALKADVRFASPGSRFGIPAAKLGLGYPYSGIAALARLVGPSTTKDMFMSARQLDAQEALRVGLVNFLVDDLRLEAEVQAYAAGIAGNAPLTVHAVKAAVRVFERYPMTSPGGDEVAALVAGCFDSEDYREGRRAFLEKRPPQFRGR